MAGAGGIIREHRVSCLKCLQLGCSSTIAELLAALYGLNMAWNSGYRKVLLTMDSTLAIRSLMEDAVASSQNSIIIRKCKELLC